MRAAVAAPGLAVLQGERGVGQAGCAEAEAERAQQHHGDRHEDQPVGDGRGGDLVRNGPVPAAPPPDGLTQREAEILGLIAAGLTNPEIAARLFLSNHTIKTHISRIFAKTGSRDRAAAIGYAHRHNIG